MKGAIAEAVARNVEAARKLRGLSQQQLARTLAELGRPMQASAVAKVESGDRRVDVDDLAALAVALNVPLMRLLLPEGSENDEVDVVPAYSVPLWSAWQWATGERSFRRGDEDLSDPDVQRQDLDYEAARPVWLRVRDQQGLSRAVRHLSWAASRALAYLPGSGPETETRAGLDSWLRKVEQNLDSVRREVEQLKDEASDRG